MSPPNWPFVILASASLVNAAALNEAPPSGPEVADRPQQQQSEAINPGASKWYSEIPTLDIYKLLVESQRTRGPERTAEKGSEEAASLERPWWEEAKEKLQTQT